MEKALTKSEILSKLFKDYNLHFDPKDPASKDNDVFQHQHYKIITRSGIEKIQKAAGITIRYEALYCWDGGIYLKAVGHRGEETTETFASASNLTSKNAYYPEMAEKRAMSRIVLKLAGLYEYGVFGQDEADDFNDAVKNQLSGGTKRAYYKGE